METNDSEFLSQIKIIAREVHSKYGDLVEFDELVNIGFIGLIQARKNFKPELGYKEATYVEHRIRWAMIDYLRNHFKNVPPQDYVSYVKREYKRRIEGTYRTEQLHDVVTSVILEKAIKKLSEKDQYIIIEYFFKDRGLKEIGSDLGITESGACVAMTRIREKLRTILSRISR